MPDRSGPILSVAVPTKNRARCAIPMIASVLSIPSPEIELVVTDNSDGEELATWVESRPADPRLRYERIHGLLSMTGNCNRAFALCRGEYVTLIGDDDTVLPSVLEACRWGVERDVDAITPALALRYMWPDLRHRWFGMRQAGRLYADAWRGTVTPGDPAAEALACVRRAGQGMGQMANVYHGLVRRAVLERLRDRTGEFCHGVSPDVYLSLALSTLARSQAWYDGALSIPGSSGASNSGRQAVLAQKGGLDDDPHMRAFRDEPWPDAVPRFFSRETAWAQAALTACAKLGREDLLREFDVARLHALCLVHHRDRKAETLEAMRRVGGGRIGVRRWMDAGAAFVAVSGRRALATAKRAMRPVPRGWSLEFGPFPDVGEAAGWFGARWPDAAGRFPHAWKP